MRPEEAISQIKDIDCPIGCNDDCNTCRFGAAIDALEKQIPKTPFLDGDGYADGQPIIDMWICPTCGADYEIECHHFKYCPNCGQAIDREELE